MTDTPKPTKQRGEPLSEAEFQRRKENISPPPDPADYEHLKPLPEDWESVQYLSGPKIGWFVEIPEDQARRLVERIERLERALDIYGNQHNWIGSLKPGNPYWCLKLETSTDTTKPWRYAQEALRTAMEK